MSILEKNSEFLFGFEASLSNPNGDPDQENKPRMDYETSTLLVSDARRKRDCREYFKKKGFGIFVDTLSDEKVAMDTMFENVREKWLKDKQSMEKLFEENPELKGKWDACGGQDKDYLEAYNKIINDNKKKKAKEFLRFNNLFLTEIIKQSLIDIRLFGSAMAVEGVTRTYTGPVQLTWGYSLHPVELVKSNTISSIMSEDASTFGKKYKVHYALVSHYGTINKFSAQVTGMTGKDRELFQKALVQGMEANQTDSKQGQNPLYYLEVMYKPNFDGYLGDLRRFVDVSCSEEAAIRSQDDISVDFSRLGEVLEEMKSRGYVEKVIGWQHPFSLTDNIKNFPEYEAVDLWEPVKTGE